MYVIKYDFELYSLEYKNTIFGMTYFLYEYFNYNQQKKTQNRDCYFTFIVGREFGVVL